jgi:hypothetical protein
MSFGDERLKDAQQNEKPVRLKRETLETDRLKISLIQRQVHPDAARRRINTKRSH